MNSVPIQLPTIDTDDIVRVSRWLGLPATGFLGADGNDPRQEVLRSNSQLDIVACPGSGKTTLLVAKIALLVDKWQESTRGICVLSHTNVARQEIESRLGRTSVGRTILAYPHFVGTIHSFVAEFLALPWIRSSGYHFTRMDDEVCQTRRWDQLLPGTRSFLERRSIGKTNIRLIDTEFNWSVKWYGTAPASTTETYQRVKEASQKCARDGYFCYDDMFIWAHDLLEKFPTVAEAIRDRFPFLFLDEVQDNNELQTDILNRLFIAGNNPVIRQRFGDPNQAIYDMSSINGVSTSDEFPDWGKSKSLPNSHRFGQSIADLAKPLGIHSYGLRGKGPDGKLFPHTIFLFDDDEIDKVLESYADTLLDLFSEPELQRGVFTAVGHVHREGNNLGVSNYFPSYQPSLTARDPRPDTLAGHIFASFGQAVPATETHRSLEKIAEGILRLAQLADGDAALKPARHQHRYVLQLLEESPAARGAYESLVRHFVIERRSTTQEEWSSRWVPLAQQIGEAVANSSLSNQAARRFLEWKQALGLAAQPPGQSSGSLNFFRHSKAGKEVAVRIGSIHSVKGETHTATLVLETFWYRYNLENLLDWLDGSRTGTSGTKEQGRLLDRMKVHYVAMTRPSHLLCLAMRRAAFMNDEASRIEKLKKHGWVVREIH